MINAMRLFVLGSTLACLAGCFGPYPRGHLPRRGHVDLIVPQPGLVLIGGTNIYWASDAEGDVFYYGGRWYWSDGPYWYGAATWGDSWVYVSRPPSVFLSIPSSHPRFYVTERHPDSPRFAQYRLTVSVGRESAPERRDFVEIRGGTSPRSAPRAGRDSQPREEAKPQPRGEPRAEPREHGSPKEPRGEGPAARGPDPDKRSPRPEPEPRETPPRKQPKDDDDDQKERKEGHKDKR